MGGIPVARANKGQQPTAKQDQQKLLWLQTGEHQGVTLADWDPKPEPFVQALLEVLATGATVVLRPGSGGRSFGIAIWEGDVRHAPKWLYDNEEVDDWASWVNEHAALRNGQAAD